ncbi:MAG: malic enzyme-like NAD(P)-binding protein [Dongiaceae bacterium]
MEGKALLFKQLGGIDAVPVCLDTRDPDEIVRTVRLLAPAFGAINLEDIAQPKCFRILEALRRDCPIPVWHDDQQGTAAVALAGLENALAVVGKRLDGARIALVGAGAANVATARLLVAAGARPGSLVVCDSAGTLHPGRRDIAARAESFPEKWRLCRETNEDRLAGGIAAALAGADACLAFSRPGPEVIRPDWVRGMAPGAIVFACANPVPEIWPDAARAAGAAIVATGRSDFPNQVNNALVFPGIFRGVLEVAGPHHQRRHGDRRRPRARRRRPAARRRPHPSRRSRTGRWPPTSPPRPRRPPTPRGCRGGRLRRPRCASGRWR